MAAGTQIRDRFEKLAPFLDERMRRLVAASESVVIGFGGTSVVSRETGVSRRAIIQGIKELEQEPSETPTRVRRAGGGRKKTVNQDTTLQRDLERLVEPVTRGDPESPLRWTCKSVRKLSDELNRTGHQTSHRMVAELLHGLGYSLQANRKTLEGSSHEDRDAQFQHINKQVKQLLGRHQPVISVDTKKKELVGDFKNSGQELRPKGDPEKVRVHDFVIPELGRAAPYGVYDVGSNTGWVSVGVDHDTAMFAVETIRTPTSASWLNQIEIWFGLLTRKSLRGASFANKDQLRLAIEDFVARTNQNPKPFHWRKREVKGSQLRNTIINLCN